MSLGHSSRRLEAGPGTLGPLNWRGDVLTASEVPTDYGPGGTTDPAVLVNLDQLVLYSKPPVVRAIAAWSGSGLLTMRFAPHRFFSFEVKSPKAVSCLSGFGLGTPTF